MLGSNVTVNWHPIHAPLAIGYMVGVRRSKLALTGPANPCAKGPKVVQLVKDGTGEGGGRDRGCGAGGGELGTGEGGGGG